MENSSELIIGAIVQHLRQSKNLSQVELAKKAGLSTSYISHIETGLKVPTFKTCVKIAKALEVKYNVIMEPPLREKMKALGYPDDLIEKVL